VPYFYLFMHLCITSYAILIRFRTHIKLPPLDDLCRDAKTSTFKIGPTSDQFYPLSCMLFYKPIGVFSFRLFLPNRLNQFFLAYFILFFGYNSLYFFPFFTNFVGIVFSKDYRSSELFQSFYSFLSLRTNP